MAGVTQVRADREPIQESVECQYQAGTFLLDVVEERWIHLHPLVDFNELLALSHDIYCLLHQLYVCQLFLGRA